MDYGQTSNFGQGAVTGDTGYGLYDFATQGANLPASQAATTASQVESGGSGFNWNAAIRDITGAWLQAEGHTTSWPGEELQYRRGEDGNLYTTDGRMVQGSASVSGRMDLGGLLMIGGLIWLVMKAVK